MNEELKAISTSFEYGASEPPAHTPRAALDPSAAQPCEKDAYFEERAVGGTIRQVPYEFAAPYPKPRSGHLGPTDARAKR